MSADAVIEQAAAAFRVEPESITVTLLQDQTVMNADGPA